MKIKQQNQIKKFLIKEFGIEQGNIIFDKQEKILDEIIKNINGKSKNLEIENKYVVIQCIYSNDEFSEKDKKVLADLHYNKIEISDAIYVVNVNGYIGNSTRKEIEYAKKHGKEIMYLE